MAEKDDEKAARSGGGCFKKDPCTPGQARASGQPYRMGSCSLWRAGLDVKLGRVRAVPIHLRSALRLSALCLSTAGVLLGPAVGEAAAQVDAGHPSGNANARTRDVATPAPSSASFKKTMAMIVANTGCE